MDCGADTIAANLFANILCKLRERDVLPVNADGISAGIQAFETRQQIRRDIVILNGVFSDCVAQLDTLARQAAVLCYYKPGSPTWKHYCDGVLVELPKKQVEKFLDIKAPTFNHTTTHMCLTVGAVPRDIEDVRFTMETPDPIISSAMYRESENITSLYNSLLLTKTRRMLRVEWIGDITQAHLANLSRFVDFCTELEASCNDRQKKSPFKFLTNNCSTALNELMGISGIQKMNKFVGYGRVPHNKLATLTKEMDLIEQVCTKSESESKSKSFQSLSETIQAYQTTAL